MIRIFAYELRDLFLNSFVAGIPFCVIRMLVYRLCLGSCGKGVVIARKVRLIKPKNIRLGDRVVVNRECVLDGRGGPLVIGDDTDLGEGAAIWTLEHDPHSETHGVTGSAVHIGDHVWVSTRVTILPGVKIGPGAVLATGAVVTKSVETKAIVGGVPARVIGTRRNTLQYRLLFRMIF